jgi:uncharacterized protein YrrD
MENNEAIDQPVYESGNQPINQPVNQLINQPAYQPTNQPIDKANTQPMNQPANQPANQPMQPISQPIDQVIKKWTDLSGLAIVSIANGAKIGTLDDFYFDPSANPAANSIRGLRIKTGMFSHRALPASAINAIGQDAITIDNEELLIREKDEADYATLPLGQSLFSYKVMSEGGTIIGTVGNVLLDIATPKALHIYAFEMAGGLRSRISGHYSTFYSQQVIRYGQDVLIIPDTVAAELTH